MRSAQFWMVVACLFATGASAETLSLPTSFGNYAGQDVPISSEALEILGKGDFLNRVYSAAPLAGAANAPVQLFIAYFPTQRSGQSIHSPQNCLPGSGWTFSSSGVTTFTDRTGTPFRVGDYVISNGRDKQEVLYWYQSHGRSIANDYMAKLLMMTDAIRYGRTDAALVRFITPVGANENPEVAHQRLVNFAENVTPLLPTYVPN